MAPLSRCRRGRRYPQRRRRQTGAEITCCTPPRRSTRCTSWCDREFPSSPCSRRSDRGAADRSFPADPPGRHDERRLPTSLSLQRVGSFMATFSRCRAAGHAWLYGVMSYPCAAPVEFGTRMALGAVGRDLLESCSAAGQDGGGPPRPRCHRRRRATWFLVRHLEIQHLVDAIRVLDRDRRRCLRSPRRSGRRGGSRFSPMLAIRDDPAVSGPTAVRRSATRSPGCPEPLPALAMPPLRTTTPCSRSSSTRHGAPCPATRRSASRSRRCGRG